MTSRDVVSTSPLQVVDYISASNYTTSATTFADVDSTNLVWSITPTTTVVHLTANLISSVPGGGVSMYVNVRDADGDIAGTSRRAAGGGANSNRLHFAWYMTGLTVGVNYSFRLGFAASTATTVTIVSNSVDGPVLLTAQSITVA